VSKAYQIVDFRLSIADCRLKRACNKTTAGGGCATFIRVGMAHPDMERPLSIGIFSHRFHFFFPDFYDAGCFDDESV
jgi:hypothetical protein